MAFQFKQWWIFRTKQSLWGYFLRAKYCQRSNPVSKKWDNGDSLTWKYMLMNRQQVEQHIQWLGIGPLEQFTTSSNKFNNCTMADFLEEGKWSWSKAGTSQPVLQRIGNRDISTTTHSRQGSKETQQSWKFNMFFSLGGN